MKVFIPSRATSSGFGGGWTFTSNFINALKRKVEFVKDWKDCDVYFIPGPTLAERDDVLNAKKSGKRIVFRIDNIPRNSRNRNTGTPRLYDFAQISDEVIYQSEWARSFIGKFVKRDGVVILNGADETIFRPDGEKMQKDGEVQYLYSQYSSDPTKQWHQAWYFFQNKFFENPKVHLWIVGRPEFMGVNQLEYHFDFFGGAEKRYKFLGFIEDRNKMAKIYRSVDCLLLPYFNDACSNTLIEGLVSGIKVWYNEEGSNKEIVQIFNEKGREYFSLENMGNAYLNVFRKILSQ